MLQHVHQPFTRFACLLFDAAQVARNTFFRAFALKQLLGASGDNAN